MATVIVSCKLPAGITLEVDGVQQKINGYNNEDSIIIYEKGQRIGVTYDVDESFFDKWVSQNKQHPLIANEAPFIWKSKNESNAKAQAKDTKDEKTGLEQKTPSELEAVAGAKKDKLSEE